MEHAWPIAYGQVISMMFFQVLKPTRCISLPPFFPESRALAWTHLGAHLPTSCAQAILTSSNQNNNISSNISPSIFNKSGSLTPPDSPPQGYTFSVHFHREKTPKPPKAKLTSQGDWDHGQPNDLRPKVVTLVESFVHWALWRGVSHAGCVSWSRTLELGWLHKRIGENKTVVICKC